MPVFDPRTDLAPVPEGEYPKGEFFGTTRDRVANKFRWFRTQTRDSHLSFSADEVAYLERVNNDFWELIKSTPCHPGMSEPL